MVSDGEVESSADPWPWFPDTYELPAGSDTDPPLFADVLRSIQPQTPPPPVPPIRAGRKSRKATAGKVRS